MKHLLLCVLFLLPSCSLVRKTEKALTQTGEVIEDMAAKYKELTASITSIKHEFIAARKKADTDGDGKTTMAEWIAYAIGVLGAGGAALSRKRKLDDQHTAGLVRNADSDERKSKMEERLEKLEGKA